MNAVADDEPLSVELLRGYLDRGQAWVIADHLDVPVAYLLADVVDGAGHVEQVSVIPGHARQGLGRVLLDHACEWVRGNGLKAVTLTTFANIPWNAPYYERCGFRQLPADGLTPGLLRIRQEEADHGLDAWPRVCMRRLLASRTSWTSPNLKSSEAVPVLIACDRAPDVNDPASFVPQHDPHVTIVGARRTDGLNGVR